VKGNQPQLLRDVSLLFTHKAARPLRAVQEVDKGHGRVETRILSISQGLEGHRPVPEFLDWPYVQQALRMERRVIDRTGARSEVRYAVTSLAPDQASDPELMRLWRGHWSIENRSHHVRDVTFDEDRSPVRTSAAPQVMAALRNTAIGLHRIHRSSNIAAACRRCAGKPATTLKIVGVDVH